MRLLNAGLSRTGTTSIHKAVQQLGLTSIHYDDERLNHIIDQPSGGGPFDVYDDIDVVGDIPSALYYQQLADAYPDAKVLLTVRDETEWWASCKRHFATRPSVQRMPFHQRIGRRVMKGRDHIDTLIRRDKIRVMAYMTADPNPLTWLGCYRDHNAKVRAAIPADRLVVMDVTRGDGWATLCDALDMPIPSGPFPHENRGS